MDKILYVKVIDRDIVVKTENGRNEDSLTKQLKYILERYGFAKLNQNVFVNLEMIKSVDSKLSLVYLDDEKLIQIQVSRRNRHKVPWKKLKKQR